MTIQQLYQLYREHPCITTDSRDCPQGSIFIALKGESFDGNKFALSALEKGCAYAIVDDPSLFSTPKGTLNLEPGTLNPAKPTRRELLIKAFRLIILDESIDYDQLILYPSFIHVSYVSRERNRRTILLGMRNGKLGYGKCSVQNALKIE